LKKSVSYSERVSAFLWRVAGSSSILGSGLPKKNKCFYKK